MACSFRRGAGRLALVCAAGLLASLTGCVGAAPEPAPRTASASPHDVAAPSTSPSTSGSTSTRSSGLADDVVLIVTGHVTADNGATASVTATIHVPLSPDDPAAAAMVSRMTGSCASEVDRSVLSADDARLVEVDDRATLLSGVWPIDLPLALGPDSTSAFVTAAAAGGVFQQQVLPAHPDPADYVPHCAEPAFLTIGRSGSVYLAEHFERTNNIGLDSATFWGHLRYGFSTPYDLFSAQRVTFDQCSYDLTALGRSRLGDNPDFRVTTGPDDDPELGDTCVAGGLTGH